MADFPGQKFKLKLVEKVQETPEVITFKFLPDKKVDYKPGQFMIINLGIIDGKVTRRSYSIASSPTENELKMTVKFESGGKGSEFFKNLEIGSSIDVDGPYGKFVFEKAEEMVFIAGGTGIAPFRSMIKYALDHEKTINGNYPFKIAVIHSVRTPDDVIYKKEMAELNKKHGDFEYVATITRHKGGETWTGELGRITADMIKRYVINPQKALIYVCGPKDMVNTVKDILVSMNVDINRVRVERWG